MKKVVILSAVNIKHMSLISLYTNYLEKNNIPYDIIYMDKYGEKEQIGAQKIYRFVNVIEQSWSRKKKIIRYFRFYGYAKKILEKNKYDRIIVWNDVAITMFGKYLAKHWHKKYCLNIRDYNGENKWYIFNIFKHAIKEAAFTTISSEGFKVFLPPNDYISLYSYNAELLKEIMPRTDIREKGKPIRISFIGSVRFFDQNKRLVDAFKNDERFELHYHGTNAEIIEQYASQIGATNVRCSGTFPISQTTRFLEESDIINNVFGDNTVGVRTLTSIRLFHAAYMRVPILVTDGTYMQELIEKYKIGFSIKDIDNELPNAIYNWYVSLDHKELEKGCVVLLEEATNANKRFETVLAQWMAR